ncbi:MAG: hypothetical protein EXQ56_13215 [Acidobacteria bacterium]|nr:hypothetical protein [Acidobacteriota bacterium]
MAWKYARVRSYPTMTLNVKFGHATLALWLAGSVGYATGPAADSRLIEAVRNQDKATVRALIKDRANVNAAQADGATPLAWAVERGDAETVDMLIAGGANVNAATDNGVTPLYLACTRSDAAIVGKLLKAGANPNAALWSGETPLMTCARSGSTAAVKLLLDRGANPNAKETTRGQTALMWAAAQKHADVVKLLVDRKADVRARSALLPVHKSTLPITYTENVHFPAATGGFTALMFAGQSGDVDSAQFLLNAGADVNERNAEDGSALILAAQNGNEKLALMLLARGADAKATDGYGLTAMHWAVQEGIKTLFGRPSESDEKWEHRNSPNLVKALLAAGGDPNARATKDFDPYLHRYARNRGNDLPQVAIAGSTPFLLAAASGDVGIMRVLLEGRAEAKITTVEGLNPLMVASGLGVERAERASTGVGGGQALGEYLSEDDEKKFLEAAKIAVQFGSDINARGPGGRTPLHAATFWGMTSVIEFLAANGADLEAQDMYGQTAMTIALGDPGQLVYRQLLASDFDFTFRNPKAHPKAVEALLKAGAAAYTGPVASRSGQ